MFSGSMKAVSVGRTSECERMKILETVTGSNQRLIQPQTVEKKTGAPMIWGFGGERDVSDAMLALCQAVILAVAVLLVLLRLPRKYPKGRRGTHEYPVQRLGIVRRRQLAGDLHVTLQVPELPQADPAHVDDVGAEGDGRARVLAVGELRAHGLGEAREVLVQREEAHHLGVLALAAVLGRLHLAVRVGGALLVGGHGLGVEVADLEQVDGDAAAVPPARPLRVQAAALLVGVDVDGVVQHVDADGGAPPLRVAELRGGVGGDPPPRAQEPQEHGVVVRRRGGAGPVQPLLGEVRLERGEGGLLVGGEVAQVAVRVAVARVEGAEGALGGDGMCLGRGPGGGGRDVGGTGHGGLGKGREVRGEGGGEGKQRKRRGFMVVMMRYTGDTKHDDTTREGWDQRKKKADRWLR